MTDAPHIVVRPSSLSTEEARSARARAWRYVFDCYAKKNAAECDQHCDGDEAKGSEHEVRPNGSIPE